MLNFVEVFDVMDVDPTTEHAVMTEPRRTSAHARSGERRRAAGHREPSGTLGRCNAFSGGACRSALMSSHAD
ncbi:hypothetical protein [Bradyrhizobium sp. NAS96.2]|uniref:hypothetical protein n=1 Tax=Bradyrhizobium sp. NAS96.2 TaxID=1680160 RepID=UPI00093FB471|nr:hypothetical protein [Bradyrhizobium sp. NAS96.2]OKO75609.1 hypothetical protein AC628_20040 [Bradyrhizobium sp. NAS96.2]